MMVGGLFLECTATATGNSAARDALDVGLAGDKKVWEGVGTSSTAVEMCAIQIVALEQCMRLG